MVLALSNAPPWSVNNKFVHTHCSVLILEAHSDLSSLETEVPVGQELEAGLPGVAVVAAGAPLPQPERRQVPGPLEPAREAAVVRLVVAGLLVAVLPLQPERREGAGALLELGGGGGGIALAQLVDGAEHPERGRKGSVTRLGLFTVEAT